VLNQPIGFLKSVCDLVVEVNFLFLSLLILPSNDCLEVALDLIFTVQHFQLVLHPVDVPVVVKIVGARVAFWVFSLQFSNELARRIIMALYVLDAILDLDIPQLRVHIVLGYRVDDSRPPS